MEYREDNFNCAGRISGRGPGYGVFVVHKISLQEEATCLQIWWMNKVSHIHIYHLKYFILPQF